MDRIARCECNIININYLYISFRIDRTLVSVYDGTGFGVMFGRVSTDSMRMTQTGYAIS